MKNNVKEEIINITKELMKYKYRIKKARLNILYSYRYSTNKWL